MKMTKNGEEERRRRRGRRVEVTIYLSKLSQLSWSTPCFVPEKKLTPTTWDVHSWEVADHNLEIQRLRWRSALLGFHPRHFQVQAD